MLMTMGAVLLVHSLSCCDAGGRVVRWRNGEVHRVDRVDAASH